MTVTFNANLMGDVKQWLWYWRECRGFGIMPTPLTPIRMFWFWCHKRALLNLYQTLYEAYEPRFKEFFEKAGIKTWDVECYITIAGPYGWFNITEAKICILYDQLNVPSTILHELIHVFVCETDTPYEEGEARVTKYAELAKEVTGLDIG